MGDSESDQAVIPSMEMKLLPPSTVRLITSSQVITSVVSVIKELIENALDANATNIEIKLDNYGFDKIEIRDNGSGIKDDDAAYMAQRHYTSKITNHSDLETLHTYGFRGEALASLCAVATVTITTKTADDAIGKMYTLDHQGKITACKPTPVNQGTTITVSQLFKNVPVRRQFFSSAKRRKEEVKRVEDLVMAFGMIRPGVRLVLRHDKAVLLQKNKVNNGKSALMSILGTNVMSQMEPVLYTNDDSQVVISGFVPKPGSDVQLTSRVNSDRCFVFVNRRPVNIKEIEKLAKQYYSNSTNSSFSHPRYPIIYLSIIVPPDVLDVNLDPNKTTVLLHNKDSILETLARMLDKVYSKAPENVKPEQRIPTGSKSSTENIKQSTDTKSPVDKLSIMEQKSTGGGNELKESSDDFELSLIDGSMIDFLNEELENFDEVAKSREMDEKSKQKQQSYHGNQSVISDDVLSKEDTAITDRSNPMDNSIIDIHQELAVSLDNGATHERISGLETANQGTGLLKPANEQAVYEADPSSNGLIMQRICSEQNELCQGQSSSSSKFGTESWSKGHSLTDNSGKIIEPVQLLTASSLQDTTPECATRPSTSRSPKSSPGRKNRPLELKEGQSTLYDMVGKTPIRRPIPPIQYFSKNIKPQVIEEQPGLDPLAVNKIVAEKWEALAGDEKKKYETMATRDADRYEEKVQSAKRPRTPLSNMSVRKNSGPSSKRKKLEPSANQTLLETMMSPVSKATSNQSAEPEVKIKVIDVPFDMETLKRKYYRQSSSCSTSEDGRLHLIGRMKPHGIWLALRKQKIVVFNVYRAEEILLYHRLMAQHVLPRQRLDVPIILNPSLVGGIVAWQTLLSMRSELRPPGPTRHYTDDRLLANGFEIQQTTDTENAEVVVKIVAMTDCLSFYSLHDLREILELVSKMAANTVAKCRPIKVIHYLKGEAVRMAHNLSSNLGRNDVQDIVDQMQLQLPPGSDKCFHERPLEIAVHSLEKS